MGCNGLSWSFVVYRICVPLIDFCPIRLDSTSDWSIDYHIKKSSSIKCGISLLLVGKGKWGSFSLNVSMCKCNLYNLYIDKYIFILISGSFAVAFRGIVIQAMTFGVLSSYSLDFPEFCVNRNSHEPITDHQFFYWLQLFPMTSCWFVQFSWISIQSNSIISCHINH